MATGSAPKSTHVVLGLNEAASIVWWGSNRVIFSSPSLPLCSLYCYFIDSMSELDSLRYPVLERDVLMRQVACMLVIVANALHIFIQADAKMVCLDPVKRTPTFYFSLSLSLPVAIYLQIPLWKVNASFAGWDTNPETDIRCPRSRLNDSHDLVPKECLQNCAGGWHTDGECALLGRVLCDLATCAESMPAACTLFCGIKALTRLVTLNKSNYCIICTASHSCSAIQI